MAAWVDREPTASPARVAAFKAVLSTMDGTCAVCTKHKQYSRGIQHFKAAIKLARAAQGTPFAVPGLVQLCWARAAECFYHSKQEPGLVTCARKALQRLGDAIDSRGVYLVSYMLNTLGQAGSALEAELLPSWRLAVAADGTRQLLRHIGWVHCGRAYCSFECAYARFTLVQNVILLVVIPCHFTSFFVTVVVTLCHLDPYVGQAPVHGMLRQQVVPTPR